MDFLIKKLIDLEIDVEIDGQLQSYIDIESKLPMQLKTNSTLTDHNTILEQETMVIKKELPKIKNRIEKQMRTILGAELGTS